MFTRTATASGFSRMARRNLALRGREEFRKVTDLAEYARREINRIGGYYAYTAELINDRGMFSPKQKCVP
mgnify:CR=1 FL=1